MEFIEKNVMIGNVNLKMPAFLVLLLGLVAGLTSAYRGNNVVGLTFILMGILNSITLNCVIKGDCDNWAWFLFFMNVFTFVGGTLKSVEIH